MGFPTPHFVHNLSLGVKQIQLLELRELGVGGGQLFFSVNWEFQGQKPDFKNVSCNPFRPHLQALEITVWSDLNHHLHFETDTYHTTMFYQICIRSLWFHYVMKGFVSSAKES